MLDGYTSKEVAAFVESCRRHDRTGDDRLAYVGVTRAKQVLIATGHWWGPTQKNARGPSEYLEALREQATGEVEDPWADEPAADPDGGAEPQADGSSGWVAEVPSVHGGRRPRWAVRPGDGPRMGAARRLADPTNPMLEQVIEVAWPAPDAPTVQGVVRSRACGDRTGRVRPGG